MKAKLLKGTWDGKGLLPKDRRIECTPDLTTSGSVVLWLYPESAKRMGLKWVFSSAVTMSLRNRFRCWRLKRSVK